MPPLEGQARLDALKRLKELRSIKTGQVAPTPQPTAPVTPPSPQPISTQLAGPVPPSAQPQGIEASNLFGTPSRAELPKPPTIPTGLALQVAAGGAFENIKNFPAKLADLLSIEHFPELKEMQSTELQEFGQALRPAQTFGQNIGAGAIGLAPYLVPIAGQALFATDVLSEISERPGAALDIIKGIGESFKIPLLEAAEPFLTLKGIPGPIPAIKAAREETREQFRQQPVETLVNIALPLAIAAGVGGKVAKVTKAAKGFRKPKPDAVKAAGITDLTKQAGDLAKPSPILRDIGEVIGQELGITKPRFKISPELQKAIDVAEGIPKERPLQGVPRPIPPVTPATQEPVQLGAGKPEIPPEIAVKPPEKPVTGIKPPEAPAVPKGALEQIPQQPIGKAKLVQPKKKPVLEQIEKPTEEFAGLTKRDIDFVRKTTFLDELPKPERKRRIVTVRKAKEKGLDRTALELADETIKSRRPITDEQHAGMVLRMGQIENDIAASVKLRSDLIKKGNDRAAAGEIARTEALIDQVDRLTRGSAFAGTESARALSARNIIISRDDFTIGRVTQRARAAKGKNLTTKEIERLTTLTDRNKVLEGQLKEVEIRLAKAEAEKQANIASDFVKLESRKPKAPLDKIKVERNRIKKELAALGFRVNELTGLSAEGLHFVGKLGVSYIREGVKTLEAVVKRVRETVPDVSAEDVHIALNSKKPGAVKKARTEATKRVVQIKRQAKLLENIEKAERGIFDKPKARPTTTPEIKALQKQLRELRNEAWRSSVPTERLERAINTLSELQDQLANYHRALRKKQPVLPEQLKAIRDNIKEVRKDMRIEDVLAEQQEQLRTGDFKIKPKVEKKAISPDRERKLIEIKLNRQKINERIRASAPVTTKSVIREGINFLRTARTIGEASGVLRQGLGPIMMRPGAAPKAFGQSVRAAFSQFKAEQIDLKIRSADHHYLRERAGLELPEIGSKLTKGEELFRSNIAEKIPGYASVVRASERQFTTFLNLMRVSVFDGFLAKYPNATRVELTALAETINVFSGRGRLKANTAENLSLFLWAPRFAVSRFQAPFQFFRTLKTPRVRNEVAKAIVRTATTGAMILGMAKLSGLEVGTNPRDSDFGKIVIENTRIDIWGGVQQPMRLIAQLGLAGTDAVGFTEAKRDIDPIDLVARFAEYKLAPHIGLVSELVTGETAVGEQTTPTEAAFRSVLPLFYQDVIDAYKIDGVRGAAITVPTGFLGVGVATFQKGRKKKKSLSSFLK